MIQSEYESKTLDSLFLKLKKHEAIVREIQVDIKKITDIYDPDNWKRHTEAAMALGLTRNQLKYWRESGEMVINLHYKDMTPSNCVTPRWSYNVTLLRELKANSTYMFRNRGAS